MIALVSPMRAGTGRRRILIVAVVVGVVAGLLYAAHAMARLGMLLRMHRPMADLTRRSERAQ